MEKTPRIQALEKVINDNAEFSLLERMTDTKEFGSAASLKNFLQAIVFLIEKSIIASESASQLLWKKIFNERIGIDHRSEESYGTYIIGLIAEQAVSPYVNLTYSVSRLIATIIYDTNGHETTHITSKIKKTEFLQFNENFLSKYIKANVLDNNTMSLFYNCVADIDSNDSKVTLSKNACRMIRAHILDGNLERYLKLFLRPYYSSMSSNWMPGARYHVPEPFYRQIFDEGELEKHIMALTDINGNNVIANDILDFMIRYNLNKSRNLEWVDIGGVSIHPKLHDNVRIVR